MAFPIYITYHGLAPSTALSADIHRHALRLERFAPRLQSCQVTVRRSERRQHKGNRFQVTVCVHLPGAEFKAGRTCDANQTHQDAYVAAHDAIDAMRRQLEDFVRIRRDKVQSPAPPT
jgi:ribosome-associated translation inhibitor RaiA